MKLQEAKDRIANEFGYLNFEEWEKVNFNLVAVSPGDFPYDKIAELYAQQRVEEATRWIPVSERLPEFNSLCLAFGVGHTPVMCRYTRRFERHIDRVDKDRTLAIYYDKITHWQPLPKAPTV